MSTRQTLVFSFLDRYAGLVTHTVSSMVIARLLTPAQIGVYSVVMVLLGWRPASHLLVTLSCLPLAVVMLALAARATRHALWIEVENVLPSLGRRLRWRN